MAMQTIKAYAKAAHEGIQVESTCRGFKVMMDEPEEAGGRNEGMTPMEMILCGLGGCQSMFVSAFAKKHGIDIQEFWVELEGEFDDDGVKGTKDIRPGFLEIRCVFHVKSKSPEHKVREFLELIEKRCPVNDTVSNAVRVIVTGVVMEED